MDTNNFSICRKDNWSQQDELLINKQINLELHAAHIYNSLYCYFQSDSIGFIGTAEFFKKSSDEENEHARKFMEYQNTRGGKVILDNIEKPVFEFDQNSEKSLLYQAFNYALETEQKVYESIKKISEETSDIALEDFLDDFLKEQLDAQYHLGLKLKQLEIIGNNGFGLIYFDKEYI